MDRPAREWRELIPLLRRQFTWEWDRSSHRRTRSSAPVQYSPNRRSHPRWLAVHKSCLPQGTESFQAIARRRSRNFHTPISVNRRKRRCRVSPSEFKPELVTEKLARPALEVDAVRWPAVCENILSRHAAAFDQLAEQLRHEAEIGCRVVAITGVERSEGRSTLALCVARRLAAGNSTVALVDADFAKPGLIQQLTVRVDRGWETVLWGERELWDIAIESVADRMALVPLGSDSNSDLPAPLGQLANCFDTLAQHYDLVLVDAGPLTGDSATPQWLLDRACGVQGIILAHDVRRRAANRVAAVCLQLAESNQRQLGIAEIFVDEQAAGGKRLAAVPV